MASDGAQRMRVLLSQQAKDMLAYIAAEPGCLLGDVLHVCAGDDAAVLFDGLVALGLVDYSLEAKGWVVTSLGAELATPL